MVAGELISAHPENAVRQEARTAVLQLLHARMPAILAANVINGVLIALIVGAQSSSAWLAPWLAGLLVACAVRFGLWLRFRRRDITDWSRRWSSVCFVGSIATGTLWGAAGFLFVDPGTPLQFAAVIFVLGGMAAGAVATLHAHLPSLWAYLGLSLLPICARLALEGSFDHLAMAAMVLIALVAFSVIGFLNHVALTRTLMLRSENRELVESLEARVVDRTRRQAMLVDFSRHALSGIKTAELLKEAASVVADGLDGASAAVSEWSPERGELVVRAAAGRNARGFVGGTYPATAGSPAGEALRTGSPSVCADLSRTAFEASHPYARAGLASIICASVQPRGATFGTLEAWFHAPGEPSHHAVDFVQAIANTLAVAIERNRVEQNLQRVALHDALTGLPNRVLFTDQLEHAMTDACREGHLMSVLLIDLDHFKDVNDTLGHSVGDAVLVEAGRRLTGCMRRSEPPTRLGGDEFALVLSRIDRPNGAAAVARKVLAALREPMHVAGHEIHLDASIGITICPLDGASPEMLLRNADLALYRAKAGGRGGYQFYSPEMSEELGHRIGIARDLRRAVHGRELQLSYQPEISLANSRIVALEALIRWQSPSRGMMLPGTFIPIAETSGLMAPLGDWTVREACSQATIWRAQGLPPFRIAVNVALSQWRRENIADAVQAFLHESGTDPQRLELEITERDFPLTDDRSLTDGLAALRRQGVTIAIDDFGTGYSNLSRLRTFPVDKLKIDGSFIRGLGKSSDAETIVRTIISLGHNMGVAVVAEGVEDGAQVDFLQAAGCPIAQGFYFGPPLFAQSTERLLHEHFAPAYAGPYAVGYA